MKRRSGALISVDGLYGSAVKAAARTALGGIERAKRGGISSWDASGVFEELVVAGDEAGAPSARTLLLLYAADLAFRLRWEIRPALADGRVVVAAPYVDTAVAFGRAAGMNIGWLRNLFAFAPRPAESHYVERTAGSDTAGSGAGLIELADSRMAAPTGASRDRFAAAAATHLRAAARRAGGRRARA